MTPEKFDGAIEAWKHVRTEAKVPGEYATQIDAVFTAYADLSTAWNLRTVAPRPPPKPYPEPPVPRPDPGTYRHHKGGYYRVLGTVPDSTNGPTEGRWLVHYVSLERGSHHVREVSQFCDSVTWPDGRTAPRFEACPIEDR